MFEVLVSFDGVNVKHLAEKRLFCAKNRPKKNQSKQALLQKHKEIFEFIPKNRINGRILRCFHSAFV